LRDVVTHERAVLLLLEPVNTPVVAGARDDVGETVAVYVVDPHFAASTAEHCGVSRFGFVEWPWAGVDAGCGLFVPACRHDGLLTGVAADVGDGAAVSGDGLTRHT